MRVLNPFGPKIAITKIPIKIIKQINKEVDLIVSNRSRLKRSDYSKKLVGQVKQEIKLSNSFVKKYLFKFIKLNVKKYIKKSTNRNLKKINLKSFWVVRQYKNEYNPIHFHSGNISGVGYLKIPSFRSSSKKLVKTDGSIDFISGNKMLLSESIHNHQPKTGDIILFPHYLMHTAYPFKTKGERRSFSFNLEIDKKIANVFSK